MFVLLILVTACSKTQETKIDAEEISIFGNSSITSGNVISEDSASTGDLFGGESAKTGNVFSSGE